MCERIVLLLWMCCPNNQVERDRVERLSSRLVCCVNSPNGRKQPGREITQPRRSFSEQERGSIHYPPTSFFCVRLLVKMIFSPSAAARFLTSLSVTAVEPIRVVLVWRSKSSTVSFTRRFWEMFKISRDIGGCTNHETRGQWPYRSAVPRAMKDYHMVL